MKKKVMLIFTSVLVMLLTVCLGVKTKSTSEARWYFSRIKISRCTIVDPCLSYMRTGKEIKPELIVSYGDKELVKNKDYEIRYYNNIDRGFGEAKVVGRGDYRGSKTIKFEIYTIDMRDCDVTIEAYEFDWTGKPIRPNFEVYFGNGILTRYEDYDYYYANNMHSGVADLWVYGIGNYEGKILKTFRIKGISMSECEIVRDKGQTYVTHNGKLLDLEFYELFKPKVEKVKKKETATEIIYSVYTTYTARGRGLYNGKISMVENTEERVKKDIPTPTPKATQEPTVKPTETPTQVPTESPVPTATVVPIETAVY